MFLAIVASHRNSRRITRLRPARDPESGYMGTEPRDLHTTEHQGSPGCIVDTLSLVQAESQKHGGGGEGRGALLLDICVQGWKPTSLEDFRIK